MMPEKDCLDYDKNSFFRSYRMLFQPWITYSSYPDWFPVDSNSDL